MRGVFSPLPFTTASSLRACSSACSSRLSVKCSAKKKVDLFLPPPLLPVKERALLYQELLSQAPAEEKPSSFYLQTFIVNDRMSPPSHIAQPSQSHTSRIVNPPGPLSSSPPTLSPPEPQPSPSPPPTLPATKSHSPSLTDSEPTHAVLPNSSLSSQPPHASRQMQLHSSPENAPPPFPPSSSVTLSGIVRKIIWPTRTTPSSQIRNGFCVLVLSVDLAQWVERALPSMQASKKGATEPISRSKSPEQGPVSLRYMPSIKVRANQHPHMFRQNHNNTVQGPATNGNRTWPSLGSHLRERSQQHPECPKIGEAQDAERGFQSSPSRSLTSTHLARSRSPPQRFLPNMMKHEVTVAGRSLVHLAGVGMVLTVKGSWVENERYGMQLQAEEAKRGEDVVEMGEGGDGGNGFVSLGPKTIVHGGLQQHQEHYQHQQHQEHQHQQHQQLQHQQLQHQQQQQLQQQELQEEQQTQQMHAEVGESLTFGGQDEPGARDMEDIGGGNLNLLAFKLQLAKQLKPQLHAQRQGFSLSVTDLTAHKWCGLQNAYQVATGRRKRTSLAMLAGSSIHAKLEAEVEEGVGVEKVKVWVSSREDELAVGLLNTIASIRQLVKDGIVRELRVFAKAKGQWVVGVIDQLEVDSETGLMFITETKTHKSCARPEDDRISSASLQVMLYQVLYDLYRSLSMEDIHDYLFHHSTAHVGLDPLSMLSLPLQEHCDLLALCSSSSPSPSPSGPTASQARELTHSATESHNAQRTGDGDKQMSMDGSSMERGGVEEEGLKRRDTLEQGGGTEGGGEGRKKEWTLSDVVRELHASLALLPPSGNLHLQEHLWQEDADVVLAEEQVTYNGEWLEKMLDEGLDHWHGLAAFAPVPTSERTKCKTCEFKVNCKAWNPGHPLSDVGALAGATLQSVKRMGSIPVDILSSNSLK